MAHLNTWEHAMEALRETTSRLLVCDSADQTVITGLVEFRATALAELMALPEPCPPHLASALQQVCEDGDKVCLKLHSLKLEMHSELAGLIQIRSILSTSLDRAPPVIDFTA